MSDSRSKSTPPDAENVAKPVVPESDVESHGRSAEGDANANKTDPAARGESPVSRAEPGVFKPDVIIPKAVVNRLSLYQRELQRLVRGDPKKTISSSNLGRLLNFTDAQVRKDLAYFGHFGYPGIGYRCDELIAAVRRILGTDRVWPVAMVGVGNLGRALLGYKGFGEQNFRIVAAFDNDPSKVGEVIDGVQVQPLSELKAVVEKQGIRLGMVVVPADRAQEVADKLVAAGVEGIVNFAPVTLILPPTVSIVGVDLAINLEQLSFSVISRAAAQGGAAPTGDPNQVVDSTSSMTLPAESSVPGRVNDPLEGQREVDPPAGA